MAYVLVVEEEDRALRYALAAGDHVVGSSESCDVRIGHPTVSRRHARLRVDAGVEVEDLGSSNGTLVAGSRLTASHILQPGDAVSFGSVAAALVEVSDSDLDTAISLQAQPLPEPPPAEPENLPAPTTVSVGSMRAFALDKLPQLVRRLEDGGDEVGLAQAVGEALVATLPCRRVEIARAGGGPSGVIFRGEPEAATADRAGEPTGSESVHEARCERGELVVRVEFRHPSQANGYRPLIEAATGLIALAARRSAALPSRPDEAPPSPPDPPTVEPEMQRLYADAGRVAQGDIGVLITGESGTGKEVLARYLHAASRRRGRPFVALNCAALPRDLLESELFGIERGVATGVDSRPGCFEQADGGTLFLDEIGDMAPETQAKILRVLQEGEVYRVGGRDPRSARVRVLAATNRDLDALIEDGSFRRDLFHRIADWRIELPPLRRRPRDIPNLAAYFLERGARQRGGRARGISHGALDALMAFGWPGNIRQLEREMARAVLFLEDGELLRTDHLAPEIRAGDDEPAGGDLRQQLQTAERRAIRRALDACEGNMSAAARQLGIGRSTLYRRMSELGIEHD